MGFQPRPDIPLERQTYALWAGETGILFLHGFMCSPKNSRPLAEYLHARGYSILCPLLSKHGHLPYKIRRVSHRQWIQEAQRALEKLRQRCEHIVVMGHSMGGALGAHLVAANPDLKGFVALAPLWDMPDARIRHVRWLRYLLPYFYPLLTHHFPRDVAIGRVLDFDPTIDMQAREVQRWLWRGTRVPLAGVDEMRRLAQAAQPLWAQITAPFLIFQGQRDRAVKPAHAQLVYDVVGAPYKELVWLPDTGHEVMPPSSHTTAQVWAQIHDFLVQIGL